MRQVLMTLLHDDKAAPYLWTEVVIIWTVRPFPCHILTALRLRAAQLMAHVASYLQRMTDALMWTSLSYFADVCLIKRLHQFPGATCAGLEVINCISIKSG